jgi:hypothetical protein
VSGQCEHVKVVGSLPQLNEWNFGCNMEDRNGAWTVRNHSFSFLPVQYLKVLYSCDRFYCETYPMVLGAQYDMLLTGPYTEETVIEFLYKYTAHNNQGDQIWESRVSRWYCFLLVLSSLYDVC